MAWMLIRSLPSTPKDLARHSRRSAHAGADHGNNHDIILRKNAVDIAPLKLGA